MKRNKSKRRKQSGKSTYPPSAGVEVRAGKQKLARAIADINDQTLAELRSRCASASSVVATIRGLPEWPDAARGGVFQWLKEIGGVSVEVNGKTFTDAFEGVLESMVGPADVAAHTASIKAAVEAAAVFHGEFPQVPADRIVKRIAEVGGPKITVGDITKRIKALGEPVGAADVGHEEGGGPDPMAAAGAYLASLGHQVDEPGEDEFVEDGATVGGPRLLYFREHFFAYSEHAWHRQSDALMQNVVVRFLQEHEEKPPTANFIASVMANLRAMVNVGNWDRDPPFYMTNWHAGTISDASFIVFSNGMINVAEALTSETPPLRPHDSRWFSEVALSRAFDPDAQCPGWLAFLNQVLPRSHDDDHRQEVLQEFAGYTLQSGTNLEKALVPYGDGGGGKSVTLNVLTGMLGEANVSAVSFESLGGEFRLNALRGKAANITREMSHIGKVNEGTIKQLISGEPVDANEKYKEPRPFRNRAKLIVATNHLPNFTDNTDGLWRRLILMPFDVKIPPCQRNPNLSSQLMQELPGIINWALAGLRRVMAQGFTNCYRCNGALALHRADCDSVADFVGALCRRVPNRRVRVQPFYELYVYYCTQRGRKPVAENEFGKRLKQLGVTKVRAPVPPVPAPRPWLYRGLALNHDGDEWEHGLAQKQPGAQDVEYTEES